MESATQCPECRKYQKCDGEWKALESTEEMAYVYQKMKRIYVICPVCKKGRVNIPHTSVGAQHPAARVNLK